MKVELKTLTIILFTLCLSSCAVIPSTIVGGAALYSVHKEANATYPRIVPDLPDITNYSFFSKNENLNKNPNITDTNKNNNDYGFDCTLNDNKRLQSECFNQFTKSLSEKDKTSKTAKNNFFKKNNKFNSSQRIPKETKMPPRTNSSSNSSNKALVESEPKTLTPESNHSIHKSDFVTSHLLKWVQAWQQKDFKLYVSFYVKGFIGTKNSHSQWKSSRRNALKNNTNISIEISNIQIHKYENLIEINFIQHFKSNGFSDIGIKELIWKKVGGSWRILKETWMPI